MPAWKPSFKSRGVHVDLFAECLRDARVQLGLGEHALGAYIGVDARTITRWERAEMAPSASLRPKIAAAVSGADDELWHELVQSLNLTPLQVASITRATPAAPPPPPDAPAPPPPRARSHADARTVLDNAIRASAEHLDVSARRLRLALGTLLADIEKLALTPSEARDLVLGTGTGTETRVEQED